jgi:hypothetical protein
MRESNSRPPIAPTTPLIIASLLDPDDEAEVEVEVGELD